MGGVPRQTDRQTEQVQTDAYYLLLSSLKLCVLLLPSLLCCSEVSFSLVKFIVMVYWQFMTILFQYIRFDSDPGFV